MGKEYSTAGKHLIADLYDNANVDLLNNEEELKNIITEAVKKSRAHLVKIQSFSYKPQGVTVEAIIKESSMEIHTYPESAYASISFYTCGSKARPEKGLAFIINALKPQKVESFIVQRGNKKDMIISQIKTKAKAVPFGFSLLIDAYKCRPAKRLNDLSLSYDFLDTLPAKIGMEKQAPPYLFRSDEVKYPDKAGLSGGVYLIESGIQYHTIVPKSFLTMIVYSCKEFDPDIVIDEIKKVFKKS